MISEGRSINVTLLFSLSRYDEVIEAYLSGLESYDGDLAPVSSVASFFVSRVDTEADRRLEEIGTDQALALRGKTAVANAQCAYELFQKRFSGERWEALAQRGARVQRPLWASTSTKNPAFRDTLYVDELIGPNTVNTMPDATLDRGPRPRHVGSHRRRRLRRRSPRARRSRYCRGRSRRRHPHARRGRRRILQQVVRGAARLARDQSTRARTLSRREQG